MKFVQECLDDDSENNYYWRKYSSFDVDGIIERQEKFRSLYNLDTALLKRVVGGIHILEGLTYILPPCIVKPIYFDAIDSSYHLEDKQRMFVFQFLYYIGLSLEDAEELWFFICTLSNELNNTTKHPLTPRMYTSSKDFKSSRHSHSKFPSNIYNTRKKKESSSNYKGGFMTCETVASYYPNMCPFQSDIEDITERKLKCYSSCKKTACIKSSSDTDLNFSTYWSPSVKVNIHKELILSEKYKVKQIQK